LSKQKALGEIGIISVRVIDVVIEGGCEQYSIFLNYFNVSLFRFKHLINSFPCPSILSRIFPLLSLQLCINSAEKENAISTPHTHMLSYHVMVKLFNFLSLQQKLFSCRMDPRPDTEKERATNYQTT